MNRKKLEKKILEEEILSRPMSKRGKPMDDEFMMPSGYTGKRRRSVRDGIRKGFDDMNKVYDGMRGFYKDLSKLLGNEVDGE